MSQSAENSAAAPVYRRSSRRRSSPLFKTNDLDNFLSNRRKERKIAQQTQINHSRIVPESPLPDDEIESQESLLEAYQQLGYLPPDKPSDENTPLLLRDTDPQAVFYRKI